MAAAGGLGFPSAVPTSVSGIGYLYEGAQSVRGHLQAELSYQTCLARFLSRITTNRGASKSTGQGGRSRRRRRRAERCPGCGSTSMGGSHGYGGFGRLSSSRGRMEQNHASPQSKNSTGRLLAAIPHRDRVFHEGDWALLEITPAATRAPHSSSPGAGVWAPTCASSS